MLGHRAAVELSIIGRSTLHTPFAHHSFAIFAIRYNPLQSVAMRRNPSRARPLYVLFNALSVCRYFLYGNSPRDFGTF